VVRQAMIRHALRSQTSWAALALCLALAACGKGDRNKCEQMCRNYATITFREVEAAKVRPDLREKALADKLTQGTEFCTNKCQAANNEEQMDCMIEAKNMRDLKACE
jgi:hypothetical protein